MVNMEGATDISSESELNSCSTRSVRPLGAGAHLEIVPPVGDLMLLSERLKAQNLRELEHCDRVSELCQTFGRWMGLKANNVDLLERAGFFHDIGKLKVPNSILNKPAVLSKKEWADMCKHPQHGYEILAEFDDMDAVAQMVLHHHERWDGTGYPCGKAGDEIPLEARIIAIADSFDAMTSERAYREAMSEEEALQELQRNAGTQFDPQLVPQFLAFMNRPAALVLRQIKSEKRQSLLSHASGVCASKGAMKPLIG